MSIRNRREYLVEYRKRPEVVARAKAERKNPERKAYMKAYCSTPEYLEKVRCYGRKYIASEKGREVRRRYAASSRGKDVLLKAQLKHYFGMTKEDYARMLAAQDGNCAICAGRPTERRLFVDHDHATGKVRALLCHSCNSLLGHARENILTLFKAADYLELHGRGAR